MRGSIAFSQDRALDAVAHLSAVRDLPVRTGNNRALAELLLARAFHASSAGADAVADALSRGRAAANRHDRRFAIEAFELARALDALAATEGVRIAAAVASHGAIVYASGVDAEAFPATLKEALAAASLPEDAARRLAAGEPLRFPLDAEADRFALLRLFESQRGFLFDRLDIRGLAGSGRAHRRSGHRPRGARATEPPSWRGRDHRVAAGRTRLNWFRQQARR